jgi:hypothetical protein
MNAGNPYLMLIPDVALRAEASVKARTPANANLSRFQRSTTSCDSQPACFHTLAHSSKNSSLCFHTLTNSSCTLPNFNSHAFKQLRTHSQKYPGGGYGVTANRPGSNPPLPVVLNRPSATPKLPDSAIHDLSGVSSMPSRWAQKISLWHRACPLAGRRYLRGAL